MTNVEVVLVVFVAGLAIAPIFLVIFRSHNERRKRFIDREDHDFETWFGAHYASTGISPSSALGVLEALSLEIGCSPTQLRPTDRIDGDLSYCPEVSDSFELADIALINFLARNGITQPLDNSTWETIDDVVRAVDIAIKSKQSPLPSNSSPNAM